MIELLAQPTPTQVLPGLSLFQQVLITLGMVVVLVAGIAYLWSAIKSGGARAASEALSAQAAEIAALEKRADRLEDERNDCTTELARVQGALDQMEKQNREFRSLIMGETLPTAMENAFAGVVQRIMAEVGSAAQRNLQAYMGTIAALESTYLAPMTEVLERLDPGGLERARESTPDASGRSTLSP